MYMSLVVTERLSVSPSVGLSVTIVSLAKTAEPRYPYAKGEWAF